jgi:hypothetical protein
MKKKLLATALIVHILTTYTMTTFKCLDETIKYTNRRKPTKAHETQLNLEIPLNLYSITLQLLILQLKEQPSQKEWILTSHKHEEPQLKEKLKAADLEDLPKDLFN